LEQLAARVKPRLRGVSHQIAFFVALAAGVVLFTLAHDSRGRTGALVYCGSLALLFGVSALYHRPTWAPGPRQWMRRLDHSAIFVLIAGTFTPLGLLLGNDGDRPLALVWAGAALGVLQSVFWVRAPKPVVAILCVALGWSAFPLLGEVRVAAGASGVALIYLGGLLYSAGALIYSLKRPDPLPAVFGYHEIFHALVIAASVCHYAVVAQIIPQL